MKTMIVKYQISIFFLLVLIIGWFPWYVGKGSVIMAAPLIVALIVALATNGFAGVKEIFKRMIKAKVNWKWYMFILLCPAVLFLIAVMVHTVSGGASPDFPLIKDNQIMILMTFLVFLIPWQSSAFLEEVGFRGFALEKLQNKFGPLFGTLILGVFFGAWLLPEFYNVGSFQYLMGGISYYPWFVLTEIGWSIIMSFVYNKTGKSALLAGYLFHASFNVWTLILLTNIIPGQDSVPFDNRLFIISGIVVFVVGIGIIIGTKGKLGYVQVEEGK